MTLARANPFRTERLEALAFQPQGTTWPALMRRLAALHYRAAIVGPEGSGKTTLLDQLATHLRKQGHHVRHARTNAHGDLWGCTSLADWAASLSPADTVLLDGADHLPRRAWRRLARRTQTGRGLIATTHRHGMLPTLIVTRTSPALLRELVRDMVDETTFAHLESRLAGIHAQHRGNLRMALLSLYDAHAAVKAKG